MGMFTSIYIDVINPDDSISNKEIQFKTGKDECEAYKIGDVLDYEIGPEDDHSDIFDGTGSTYIKGTKEYIFYDFFVVIINKRIVAVVPSVGKDRWVEIQLLRLCYNINPQLTWEELVAYVQQPHWYNKLWEWAWPWSKKNKQRRKCKNIDWEEVGKNLCNPIKQQIGYEGLARQIFKVEPIEGKNDKSIL